MKKYAGESNSHAKERLYTSTISALEMEDYYVSGKCDACGVVVTEKVLLDFWTRYPEYRNETSWRFLCPYCIEECIKSERNHREAKIKMENTDITDFMKDD